MKGAEALAFPSLYEGFGIPVLEAMRLGTPVIASNLPVIQEWFADCFEPFHNNRDSWMMAGDLARFLGDPQRRSEVQKRALARSMEFSSGRTAEETLQFLSDVADEFRPNRRRRLRTYRDMAELKRKTCRLLFHVLIDTADPDKTHRAIVSLKKLTTDPARGARVVWVCPYSANVNSPTAVQTGENESRKPSGVQKKNAAGRRDWGWIKESAAGVTDVGELVYFDETNAIADRLRAIPLYAT